MSAVIEHSEIALPQQPLAPIPAMPADASPAAMIVHAIKQGASLEMLRELYALKKEFDADEARNAYNTAVAAFKANPPTITKDKKNLQYNSYYTTLANLVNTANAAMAPHGLSARWDVKQDGKITVTCILSHVRGHSERVEMSGQPDTSGSKNALQQIKSTVTYLRGATFEAVTGIASLEHNVDDDGNGAGKRQPEAQPQAGQRQATQSPEQIAKRKVAHDAALGRHSESIKFIKERIAAGDLKAVASEWFAISQDDQMALWLATKHGGCFTTAERETMKNDLPK